MTSSRTESSFFDQYFQRINHHLCEVRAADLEQGASWLRGVTASGGKVIVVGNGGSAAIASHVAVDLTKGAGVRAVNFNESDLITCFANDYGYENWVEKALEFYADAKDVAVLISSSGKSKNIVNGATKARQICSKVITLSGFNQNNPLREIGHLNLWVNSQEYNVVETVHCTWLLAMIDKIISDKIISDKIISDKTSDRTTG